MQEIRELVQGHQEAVNRRSKMLAEMNADELARRADATTQVYMLVDMARDIMATADDGGETHAAIMERFGQVLTLLAQEYTVNIPHDASSKEAPPGAVPRHAKDF